MDTKEDTVISSSSVFMTSQEASTGTKTHGTKEEKPKKTSPGIVYLSRIPPFMQPQKVKLLLSQFGTIGRVYLQPEGTCIFASLVCAYYLNVASVEDALIHKRRQKFRGNKKRNYTEGWVEFLDKRIAKSVALALNNTPIGGKKRSYYYDDLWNMKYLSKFKWTHLTEKIGTTKISNYLACKLTRWFLSLRECCEGSTSEGRNFTG